MNEVMEERLAEMEQRKEQLEELINQRQAQINRRAATLKKDIEARFQPKEVIRQYPLASAGMLFGIGVAIGGWLKKDSPQHAVHSMASTPAAPRAAQPQPAPNYHHAPPKQQSKLSGLASDLAFDFLNAMKEVLVSYAIEYASEKFKEKASPKKNG
ncbi:hypothetical protein Ctha_0484 [Chloroherpeton thalassium ATCC 35110]|uniref:Uncharacterized protein n=1 Tax=Chloroherpeton thalassium (strain ATCC 35110 / GB-78) TaxID=517418 RepID=B3QUP9_CHLT3|nr:hypothetical protein [Chloroherpeton thalassium]ACF12955.1 hypothetical protein Ctha_0484 [Chloroherpeton thalassium ATCC 35110]